ESLPQVPEIGLEQRLFHCPHAEQVGCQDGRRKPGQPRVFLRGGKHARRADPLRGATAPESMALEVDAGAVRARNMDGESNTVTVGQRYAGVGKAERLGVIVLAESLEERLQGGPATAPGARPGYSDQGIQLAAFTGTEHGGTDGSGGPREGDAGSEL